MDTIKVEDAQGKLELLCCNCQRHTVKSEKIGQPGLYFGKGLENLRSLDSKTLATLAFRDASGAEQNLLTDFADLGGPA